MASKDNKKIQVATPVLAVSTPLTIPSPVVVPVPKVNGI